MPKRMRDAVERDLQSFVELDPYVLDHADHKYFVRSLYCDDASFSAFHDKHDGLHTRSKFRVRTYTDAPSDTVPAFLEIKGRHNNLGFKHRVPLRSGGGSLLGSGPAFLRRVLELTDKTAVRDQFEYEIHRKRLRPVALVDFRRRPYVSKYDPDFRLTFDEQLFATDAASLFPPRSARRRGMIRGSTVLEVKFRRHIPSWFHRIIQSHQLKQVSISKICEAVETLGLATNLS